jgi:neurotransmitter:Na+ symporter, NSS family
MALNIKREGWGTKLGVILAVAGSAVGLGNFLRFPGVAAQNGGGAFMIPYFVAFLLLGIPICWSEWIMGRMAGRKSNLASCPGIYGFLTNGGKLKYVGALGLFIPIIIYMWYVYVESWCLAYAWFSLTGVLSQPEMDFTAFALQFIGAVEGGEYFSSVMPAFCFFLITFFVNFFFVYRGLSRGIERFCVVAMPILGLCALVVLFRVLTLPPNSEIPAQNLNNGMGFMWNPDWVKLGDPNVWLAACAQIFFSLSVGFGLILTYSSYLNKKDDVVLSGLTASATNGFCEICLGGLIVLPAAFIFLGAKGTQEAVDTGSAVALGFFAMPNVFQQMPVGQVFSFLFYFLLFLAGVTSSLSMLQPAIAFFEEGFALSRRVAVTFLGMITFIGASAVIWSEGTTVMDTLEAYGTNLAIPLLAFLQLIIFIFVIKVPRAVKEGNTGADLKLPFWYPFVITYVTPLFLVAVLGSWFYKKLKPLWLDEEFKPLLSLEKGTIMGMIVILFMFAILVKLAWPQMRQRAMIFSKTLSEEDRK